MSTSPTRPRRILGFTLIELMVTVAILAVLGAVAFPSYQGYLRKSRRADARTLLQAAQFAQEKYRSGSVSYADATASSVVLTNACPTSGNCDSPSGYYRLSISVPAGGSNATDYHLEATALSGTSQYSDTACRALWVEQAASVPGLTYGSKNSAGTSVSSRTPCWGQ